MRGAGSLHPGWGSGLAPWLEQSVERGGKTWAYLLRALERWTQRALEERELRPRGERGLSKVTTMLATQLRGLDRECF